MMNRFRRNTRKSSSYGNERNFDDFLNRNLSRDTMDSSLRKDANGSSVFRNKIEEEEEDCEENEKEIILSNLQSYKISKSNSINTRIMTNKVNINSSSSYKNAKSKLNSSKNSIKDTLIKEGEEENPNNGSSNFKAVHKKNIPHLDCFHMKLLFRDFITDENLSETCEDSSQCDFKNKLKDGVYCEDFYQNVYCKYNGLTESLANKRKHVCLKLLNILKLIMPEIDTETLKKTIIFIEYSIRTKDPTLGNIYRKKLENFYDRIKEILSLTTESLNLNINVQTISSTKP